MTFIKAILKWRDKTGGDDTAGITKMGSPTSSQFISF